MLRSRSRSKSRSTSICQSHPQYIKVEISGFRPIYKGQVKVKDDTYQFQCEYQGQCLYLKVKPNVTVKVDISKSRSKTVPGSHCRYIKVKVQDKVDVKVNDTC